MNPCEGLIVINTGAAALITGAGLAMAGAISAVFWQAIKGRDNHISYAESVNSDLTDTNKVLTGTAAGAVEVVKRERRAATGRQRS